METIIITGASGQLGQAVLNKLSAQGYHLALAAAPGGHREALAGPNISIHEVDLLDEEATCRFVEQVVAERGAIRAAVLLVGGFAAGGIRDTARPLLEKMFQLNFLTAYHIARPLLMHFDTLKGRRQLVFIGSRPGIDPSETKKDFAYGLSKSLLFRLAETINADRVNGIAATVIVPATLDTPLNRVNMPGAHFDDWVRVEQVAELIAFILSETGQSLRENVIKIYNNA
jgi:NAD(P)-dependent dehydrogenase (short-subunit alcohol dehydrogenase family)